MDPLAALTVAAAGVAAGAINAVVGSGTLLTFPVLLSLGYPPVTANVSNNLGLVPGAVAGAWGYRRELAGQGSTLRRLAPSSALGGLVGALLLLRLPARVFEAVVPALIGLAVLLVLAQPLLARRLARRVEPGRSEPGRSEPGRSEPGRSEPGRSEPGRSELGRSRHARVVAVALWAGVLLIGVYGGYFGAAQGVLLLGLLGALLTPSLQRANAVKNVLGSVVNGVASAVFVLAAHDLVNWTVVVLIALGSIVGGTAGARLGRRLSPSLLRWCVVLVGVTATLRLVAV